jgi:hypothetical protein
VQRPFLNYADQRNWAIQNLPLKHEWQLHIDADEELTPELAQAIAGLDLRDATIAGYIFGRKIVFLGKVLRFGAIAKTWHCRLFRTGAAHCEDRLYDQHFVCRGRCVRIDAFMLDHQEQLLTEWTARHNRWSDLEVDEILAPSPRHDANVIAPSATGNVIERKRYMKMGYYKLPLFVRSFSYFIYSAVFRLGLLDGVEGLIYQVLQSFWFRFLIDAKIYERRKHVAGKKG